MAQLMHSAAIGWKMKSKKMKEIQVSLKKLVKSVDIYPGVWYYI